MIEVLDAATCTACDLCVKACPTNVFDAVPGGVPVIARIEDCQTCYVCELYCPVDALYVEPEADRQIGLTVDEVRRRGLFGTYRATIGWTPETRDRRFVDDGYKFG